jgi:zinc/manganese transport system substrate-binding protein
MRSALLLIPALLLAGCATTPAIDDGRVHVVASTNVYGSIVDAIGGDLVTVTSLIGGAAQDPHSFEASARDQLAIAKADLVIENGGGYDDFVDTLLDASSTTAVVLTAAEVVALPDGANEHLWYSFGDIQTVAAEIADQLSSIDTVNATSYEANLVEFTGQVAALSEQASGLAAGATVAITEPVPLYLLEQAGFENVTPAEFSEAIEEGTDVPPAVLADTLNIVPTVALLAYNSQTASPETEQVKTAAKKAGVPVVEFTETLPPGESYISWMTANVAALTAL